MVYQRFWLGFKGRINRARYLLASLAIFGAMLVTVVLLAALGARYHLGDGRFSMNLIFVSASIKLKGDFKTAWWFPGIVTLPSTLAFAWAYTAVAIKRLHDRNKSGWWLFPFGGLTALHVQFGDWLGHAPAFIGLVSSLLLLWGFVEMGFLKGTGGPNRFGPDPRARRPNTTPRWDQHGALLPN